jgi:hypothetical protein
MMNETRNSRNVFGKIVDRVSDWDFSDWVQFVINVGILVMIAKAMFFGW